MIWYCCNLFWSASPIAESQDSIKILFASPTFRISFFLFVSLEFPSSKRPMTNRLDWPIGRNQRIQTSKRAFPSLKPSLNPNLSGPMCQTSWISLFHNSAFPLWATFVFSALRHCERQLLQQLISWLWSCAKVNFCKSLKPAQLLKSELHNVCARKLADLGEHSVFVVCKNKAFLGHLCNHYLNWLQILLHNGPLTTCIATLPGLPHLLRQLVFS